MAKYIVTTAAQVAFLNYLSPGRVHTKGQVVDLSAGEVTAIGAGNLRAVSTATSHDQLGEAVGVSNGS
jgi:hypothetical protein